MYTRNTFPRSLSYCLCVLTQNPSDIPRPNPTKSDLSPRDPTSAAVPDPPLPRAPRCVCVRWVSDGALGGVRGAKKIHFDRQTMQVYAVIYYGGLIGLYTSAVDAHLACKRLSGCTVTSCLLNSETQAGRDIFNGITPAADRQ